MVQVEACRRAEQAAELVHRHALRRTVRDLVGDVVDVVEGQPRMD